MKKTLLAIAAGLLLSLPAACAHHGKPGGPGCPKHQSCECRCRQQPDCPKKADCSKKADCPQHRQQEQAPPAK